jgi:WD40 repeat protein
LVSGGGIGDVLLWDVETGELLQRLLGHSGIYLTAVKVSPDGQTAITGGGDGSLHFWDITQGAATQVFEEHQFRDLPHVTLSPDGTQAVSIAWNSPNGEIDEAILWDTNTLEVIHRLPGIFITAHFLPDGRSVILGGIVDYIDFQSQLVHWDIESGQELGRKRIPGSTFFYDLDVGSDGTSILFVDDSNVLYHYDIETLSEIETITLPKESEWLQSVVFSPDGRSALAGGDAGDVILFDLNTGEVIQRYKHVAAAQGLAFSEDGERFVSVGGNNTIVLWDVASGEVIQSFNGHSGEVTSVVFTPDESQIISASGDGTLILWDVASGEALRTFSEHDAHVAEVSLSPDGQLAYSAAYDGKVIVRPISVLSVDEMLAHIADNRALHEFTCEERDQFRILPLCDADGLVPDSGN